MKSTTIFSFLNRDASLPEKFIGKRFPVSLFGKQTLPAIQRNECVRGNRQYGAADYRVIGFNIRTIQENVGRYDFVLYKIAARVSQYRCKIRGVFKLIKNSNRSCICRKKFLTKGLMKWIIKKAYKIFPFALTRIERLRDYLNRMYESGYQIVKIKFGCILIFKSSCQRRL